MARKDDDMRPAPERAGDDAGAFFADIERGGQMPASVNARDAVVTVLCILSRRLSRGEAMDFARSLPQELAEMMRPCVERRRERPEIFDRDAFDHLVALHLEVPLDDAQRAARAVFAAVHRHFHTHELDEVAGQLPKDLARIWRQPGM